MTWTLAVIGIIIVLCVLLGLDFYFGQKALRKPERGPAITTGDAKLICTGYHFFDALFTAIEAASFSIHIQFYIIRNDDIGKKLASLLKKKAAEGVEVRVLADYMGSFGLKKKEVEGLKNAGVEFHFSNPPRFPYFFYRLNARNHRKIAVIDGTSGFLGGFNIGDEYLGKNPKLGDWRDYHLQLEGPVVHVLQKQFLTDWNLASNQSVSGTRYFSASPTGRHTFSVLPSSGRAIHEYLLDHINKARASLWIGTPYFIPGKKIMAALIEALQRGVNVTLIVPMKADHPFVQEGSYRHLKKLLQEGCTIYQYYPGFYHAKIFVMDGKLCDIGTANFDLRSFFLNEEINCMIHGADWVEEIKKAMDTDIDRSMQLTLEHVKHSFWVKVKEAIAFVLSPLL